MKTSTYFLIRTPLFVTTIVALSLFAHTAFAQSTAPTNLVTNGAFEQVNAQGNPTGWTPGKWGTISAQHVYPVSGVSGNAAEVRVTSRTSGDAKWSFAHVPVTQGTYTYSNSYKSNAVTSVVVEYRRTNGSLEYVWFSNPPARTTWTNYQYEFTVPAGVTSLTVYHLLAQPGTLTLDNVALVPASNGGPAPEPTPVPEPTPEPSDPGAMVSVTFDDAWASQYKNAYPLLEQYGIRGTFYITTMYLDPQKFAGFMTRDNVRELHTRGHEIAGHTVSHPYLTTVSAALLIDELSTSKADLESIIGKPVYSFAYPYGAYNLSVTDAVKNAGYNNARTVEAGLNTTATDPFRLQSLVTTKDTPLNEVYRAIDRAQAEGQWLTITFHEIDTNGRQYANTPEYLEAVLNYIQTVNIAHVTVAEGYTAHFK